MSRIITDISGLGSDTLPRIWLNEYDTRAQLVAKSAELEEETDPQDDFLAEELVIAAALSYLFLSVADETIDTLMDTLENNLSRLDDVIATLGGELSDIYDTDTNKLVVSSLTKEMIKGASLGGGYDLILPLNARQEVLDGMVGATKYYTNNYFNRFVVPSLQSAVENFIITGDADDAAFAAIRQGLDDRLKTVPYWRVVANAAASRSYHYGMVKAGSQAGMTGYVLRAIIDGKTSKVCKNLNGREFWLADAAQLIERVARTEDIEEVKELMPWMKYDDVKDLSNAELAERGVLVPPFHGGCRTTIQIIN